MHDRTTGRTPAVAQVPSFLIAVAARVLPGGTRRDRYRREFLAELHGMTRRQQTIHALQILASSWSLRSATSYPRPEETIIMPYVRNKPLLCLLGLHHHWEGQSSPDGERYQRCIRCGRDRMDYPWGQDPRGRNTIGA